MANTALSGLNIVVTRPRDQAVHLSQAIERAGGTVRLFPLLEIEEVTDKAVLHEQVSRLSQFDLAIFISPNAVRYGMAEIAGSGALPQRLMIATVGQGSAKALRELGIGNIIAPAERFDSEGLLALPEVQHVSGKRVLILRGDAGRELLGDTLKARGAIVEYATCYRRIKPRHDVLALLDPVPDAILISSSEALGHLGQMLDECEGWAGGQQPLQAVRAIPLFVQHARIAEAARVQGWTRVNLTGAGDEGLVTGLAAWAQQRGNA